MIFSDLGTLAAEETRGFSAYRWIRDSLVARGVPIQCLFDKFDNGKRLHGSDFRRPEI
jgi:hypothetical protein